MALVVDVVVVVDGDDDEEEEEEHHGVNFVADHYCNRCRYENSYDPQDVDAWMSASNDEDEDDDRVVAVVVVVASTLIDAHLRPFVTGPLRTCQSQRLVSLPSYLRDLPSSHHHHLGDDNIPRDVGSGGVDNKPRKDRTYPKRRCTSRQQ